MLEGSFCKSPSIACFPINSGISIGFSSFTSRSNLFFDFFPICSSDLTNPWNIKHLYGCSDEGLLSPSLPQSYLKEATFGIPIISNGFLTTHEFNFPPWPFGKGTLGEYMVSILHSCPVKDTWHVPANTPFFQSFYGIQPVLHCRPWDES